NWAHQTCGHVFQGRYNAIIIEDLHGVMEVARYLHLNPVRVERLGLGKAQQKRAKRVAIEDPGSDLVQERLEILENYPWSSWRVYAGHERAPRWLETSVIEAACGGRGRAEQRKALRAFTEAPVRQGKLDSPWKETLGGLALGSPDFLKRLLKE